MSKRPKHRTITADQLRGANDNGQAEAEESVAFGRALLEQLRGGGTGEATERYRRLAEQRAERAEMPVGVVLASFPRRRGEELRVTREVFVTDEGDRRPYVAIRLWHRDHAGRWGATRKGVTVRMHEIDTVAGALAVARDEHGGE